MEQLYTIRVNRTQQQVGWNNARIEYLEKKSLQGPLHENEVKDLNYRKEQNAALLAAPVVYHLHSGGKGNGAFGGLYTKKQINRILGRYNKGEAEAIPVALNVTDEAAEEALEDQAFLECLRAEGVDNWDGYEFAQERYREEGGHDD